MYASYQDCFELIRHNAWIDLVRELHSRTYSDQQEIQLFPDSDYDMKPRTEHLFIGCDFSGHGDTRSTVTYAFLSRYEESFSWSQSQADFRDKHCADGRRISFKSLRNTSNLKAARELLQIAGGLTSSILSTFTFPKQFIKKNAPFSKSFPRDEFEGDWKPKALEEMVRKSLLIALIWDTHGTTGTGATIIMDNDSSAANEVMESDMRAIIGDLIFAFDPHQRDGFDFILTANDCEHRFLEDWVSIPDLAAGAINDLANSIGDFDLLSEAKVDLFALLNQSKMSGKSTEILAWIYGPKPILKVESYFISGCQNTPSITLIEKNKDNPIRVHFTPI